MRLFNKQGPVCRQSLRLMFLELAAKLYARGSFQNLGEHKNVASSGTLAQAMAIYSLAYLRKAAFTDFKS